MSDEQTIEQRLAALEATVRELQRSLLLRNHTPDANWLDKIGPITDHEAFREALEYGRAYRYADRPADESGEQS